MKVSTLAPFEWVDCSEFSCFQGSLSSFDHSIQHGAVRVDTFYPFNKGLGYRRRCMHMLDDSLQIHSKFFC